MISIQGYYSMEDPGNEGSVLRTAVHACELLWPSLVLYPAVESFVYSGNMPLHSNQL